MDCGQAVAFAMNEQQAGFFLFLTLFKNYF
jgi:hypothetical protein